MKSPPYFWLALLRTKLRWRFRKILSPSQNIWTLQSGGKSFVILVFYFIDFINLWGKLTIPKFLSQKPYRISIEIFFKKDNKFYKANWPSKFHIACHFLQLTIAEPMHQVAYFDLKTVTFPMSIKSSVRIFW